MSSWQNLPRGWRAASGGRLSFIGARLVDPQTNLDRVADIHIDSNRIAAIGEAPDGFDGERIDAAGWVIAPGFFDMHVHLREPGFEHKETVKSGCVAAAAGGFTGVACMPNTSPALDNPGVIARVRAEADGSPVEVHPIAATTKGRKGETLTEMAELYAEGVRAFSDDGSPVASTDVMRRALEYSGMLGAAIIEHCEEPSLTAGGVMHEGEDSTRLGLAGWPAIGEEIALQRNIALAEYTGGNLHAAHVSTARGVELIRDAKRRGVRVTAEVTPHHLSLDCKALSTYNADYKVNPPLRESADVEALIAGLADGTIDCIATDHAPHQQDEKGVEIALAPFGMLGLETALGVVHTRLVQSGRVSLVRMIDAFAIKPREIMNLPAVRIEVGATANLTIFDPEANWTVDRESMHSKSKNTPFHGWTLKGKAVGVVNRGFCWIQEN